ncbi:cytochrome c3 family protein [Roseiconus nitratireducens]|uniref:Cytochrome c3 family protein n=1 Tax=Roseiconus nitratireducens TaxID=2605748 RepID=A0A5M6D5E8_9BACT|nr:cytochrome c3 family protein [Roseiconus nitratireducens]KAA5541800.1 cytochrome c3 family protein [Roseiconus nitratireducens]
MPQLFSRAADTWFRMILAVLVIGTGVSVGIALAVARSPYLTGQNRVPAQPVPFSHQHHVSDIGIDCRYCHRAVETSASAGLPTTQICMNCHRQVFADSEMLAPVRASYRRRIPIVWNRVHDLPDYVYFNHAIHVHKGIGCYSCHGAVGEMPLIRQDAPLTMKWCLDCHRDPQRHVRPKKFVYSPQPLESLIDTDQTSLTHLRSALVSEYQIQSKVDCYTCHR